MDLDNNNNKTSSSSSSLVDEILTFDNNKNGLFNLREFSKSDNKKNVISLKIENFSYILINEYVDILKNFINLKHLYILKDQNSKIDILPVKINDGDNFYNDDDDDQNDDGDNDDDDDNNEEISYLSIRHDVKVNEFIESLNIFENFLFFSKIITLSHDLDELNIFSKKIDFLMNLNSLKHKDIDEMTYSDRSFSYKRMKLFFKLILYQKININHIKNIELSDLPLQKGVLNLLYCCLKFSPPSHIYLDFSGNEGLDVDKIASIMNISKVKDIILEGNSDLFLNNIENIGKLFNNNTLNNIEHIEYVFFLNYYYHIIFSFLLLLLLNYCYYFNK